MTNYKAFSITNIDAETGTTTIVLHKGMIGPVCNCLCGVDADQKAAGIIKELGRLLKIAGNYHYNKSALEDIEKIFPDVMKGS